MAPEAACAFGAVIENVSGSPFSAEIGVSDGCASGSRTEIGELKEGSRLGVASRPPIANKVENSV